MNTSAMQRYAPRLDELNHTRMGALGSEPSLGYDPHMFNSINTFDPRAPRPRQHGGFSGFAPGPHQSYSNHNSAGWLYEEANGDRRRIRKGGGQEMDGELNNFIKVWIVTNISLCYCYYIASQIPKGLIRLISLLPILIIFILLPLNLHSFHLCGPTTFFLVWLGIFKLLLFSFDHGPLSPTPPSLVQFISISCLPIKIKQTPPPKSPPNTNPSHQITQKPRIPVDPSGQTATNTPNKSILLAIKALLLALVIKTYDYRPHLHPYIILALYCCHMYLGIEIVLALSAIPARAVLGFELEPQFTEPYLSTSLQDFWGRRWNLMVTSILRPTIYDPICRISTRIIGPRWARFLAVTSTFAVSGLMHEVIYYYLTRVSPTWEVTWFFLLQGMCVVIEVEVKKAVTGRWRLHPVVSGPLTIAFLAVTGNWLFFPQLLRNGVDLKAINEYAIMVDFANAHLPLHINGAKTS